VFWKRRVIDTKKAGFNTPPFLVAFRKVCKLGIKKDLQTCLVTFALLHGDTLRRSHGVPLRLLSEWNGCDFRLLPKWTLFLCE